MFVAGGTQEMCYVTVETGYGSVVTGDGAANRPDATFHSTGQFVCSLSDPDPGEKFRVLLNKRH